MRPARTFLTGVFIARMRRWRSAFLPRRVIAFAWILFLLGGCSSPAQNPNDPNLIPTLTPTADVNGYQSIAPRSCLVGEWDVIQTNKAQGDLIAWQPGQHRLAYLAPSTATTWYTGRLALRSGDDFTTNQTLAENILSTGDLTWSPNGARLAFLAFRVDESLETILATTPDGGAPVDLFPLDAARTDARTSQKSILHWLDNNRVRVLTSCGEDCQQQIDIDTRDGSAAPAAASQRKNAGAILNRDAIKIMDGLTLSENVLEYDAQLYPRGFSRPNWSPDAGQVTYIDRRGLLWLINLSDKKQWIVDIGLRVVSEVKWSSDSHLLAVRAEDRIFVLEGLCTQRPSNP